MQRNLAPNQIIPRLQPKRVLRRLKVELWRRLFARLPLFEVTTRTRYGRMTYLSWDRHIGLELFADGSYDHRKIEDALFRLRSNHLPVRGTLLDVGANIGTVCIPLVTEGTYERAVAFEPDPRNVKLLRRNIRQNQLEDRITVVACALSSESGQLQLQRSERNFGDHRLGDVQHEEGSGSVSVQVDTLDRQLARLGLGAEDVGLLWMDVQGHEPGVLAGASAFLKARLPMVVEYWPGAMQSAGFDLRAYQALLAGSYRAFCDLGAGAGVQQLEQLASVASRCLQEDTFTDLLLF